MRKIDTISEDLSEIHKLVQHLQPQRGLTADSLEQFSPGIQKRVARTLTDGLSDGVKEEMPLIPIPHRAGDDNRLVTAEDMKGKEKVKTDDASYVMQGYKPNPNPKDIAYAKEGFLNHLKRFANWAFEHFPPTEEDYTMEIPTDLTPQMLKAVPNFDTARFYEEIQDFITQEVLTPLNLDVFVETFDVQVHNQSISLIIKFSMIPIILKPATAENQYAN